MDDFDFFFFNNQNTEDFDENENDKNYNKPKLALDYLEPEQDISICLQRIEPTIQNIVCTINLRCAVNLNTVARLARNTEFNPRRFAAVIIRIRNPRTTSLVFSSGKLVVTGARREDEARIASRRHARIIQKLGFNAVFGDFVIQNIVASCDVGFKIRLEGIAREYQQCCSYEPELFPGLIYRLTLPKIVILIFVSGAKLRTEINQAFKMICPVLLKHKRET